MKWQGNLSFRSVERPKELTNAFRGREKVEKIFFLQSSDRKKKVSLLTSRSVSI